MRALVLTLLVSSIAHAAPTVLANEFRTDGGITVTNSTATTFSVATTGFVTSVKEIVGLGGITTDGGIIVTDSSATTFSVTPAGAAVAKVSVGVGAGVQLFGVAPTISSGFGTGAGVVAGTSVSFEVDVGTGGAATTGVIALPTAAAGWNCACTDITTKSATVFLCKQTASATTTATIGNFDTTGAAAAWVASDKVRVTCTAY